MTFDLIPWLQVRTVQVPGPLESPCWEWTGGLAGGDPDTRRDRRPCCRWQGKCVYVARLVLTWALGRPLQPHMLATHRCDNDLCVHPNHLQEGSYSANLVEAYTRGRRQRPSTFTTA